MAAFPRALHIGPFRLKVTRDRDHLPRGSTSDGPLPVECPLGEEIDFYKLKKYRRVVGAYSYYKHRITVDPELPPSVAREVLTHEITHAIVDSSGLTDDPVIAKREEHIVSMIAPLWLEVLRRNPTLVRYLTATDV
jgi:hypothetical protein